MSVPYDLELERVTGVDAEVHLLMGAVMRTVQRAMRSAPALKQGETMKGQIEQQSQSLRAWKPPKKPKVSGRSSRGLSGRRWRGDGGSSV